MARFHWRREHRTIFFPIFVANISVNGLFNISLLLKVFEWWIGKATKLPHGFGFRHEWRLVLLFIVEGT